MESPAKETMVDSFLVEALENTRHRLTILRIELDVQRFLHSPDQLQFEFPHYPTSYLRLAAHCVAQHYGLQTMVQDNSLEGLGNRIVAWKTTESRYPGICLSEILTKQLEDDKTDHIKLVIRPRPNRSSEKEADRNKFKENTIRSMEERKEEYDKARARIFSISNSPDSDGISSQGPTDGKNLCTIGDDNDL